MSLALKCDICGKFYKPYGKNAYDGNDINFMKLLYKDYCDEYMTNIKVFDCCPECMKSILQHIEHLKENNLLEKEDLN